MTDEATVEEKAPKDHHFADFHGRRVLVKDISVGQRMVAQGIVKGLGDGSLTDADVPRLMEKIWALIDSLLPRRPDLDFIEMLLLSGKIDFEQLGPLVLAAPPAAPKPVVVKQPKRAK